MKNTSKYAMMALPALAVTVLTGCGGSDAEPGQINNEPSGGTQASASASDQSARDAQQKQASQQVSRILDTVSDTAPGLLKQSNQAVQDNILNPYFHGESSAMQWVTLLGLGAHVDADSITLDDDEFHANIVDKGGKTLAEVSGILDDDGSAIKPTDYLETDAGEDYRSKHMQEVASWATN